MHPQLKLLIELQSLDSRISSFEKEKEQIPQFLQELRDKFNKYIKEVDELKSKLEKAKRDSRSKEKEIETLIAKQVKCEAKLYEVKTNKEYSALLSEIETIKQEKIKTEEDALDFMELVEKISGEIKETESQIKKKEAEFNSEKEKTDKRLQQIEENLSSLQGDRTIIVGKLEGESLAIYQRLIENRGGLAVVPIQDEACSGCHMSLPPQRYSEVRSSTQILTCEICGRILYWNASE